MTAHRIADVAAALGLEHAGDGDLMVRTPAPPAQAGPEDLAVAMDPKFLGDLAAGRARAAVLPAGADWRGLGLAAAIFAPRARYAMAGLTARFQHPVDAPAGVHPSAIVDPSAEIGPGASIGPFVVIGRDVKIGARARILSHVSVGAEARIGDDALLMEGVRIGARARIGHRFIAHPNAVAGADGFSFVTPEPGAVEAAKDRGASDVFGAAATVYVRIHSLGSISVGDDVELGAGACLDRGTLKDTTIGNGTKIDNLVQVGHNVSVGAHCLLCAHVGIAGSAVIEDRVVLGGKAGVADHLTIGHDSVIAGGSGVGTNVPPRSVMIGSPAMKRDEFNRMYMAMRRLPRAMDKLRALTGSLR
ncbi:UDP-3-O-(3-hydroxymyristoyl)glucosamine N-acyltransferase [Albimonas sp. CAU 1670]|uniref:UDP-3-O-(3-hydroxymyristoyl)glucosamine N-acyltransferase n=1 Tax=Albimonas sp. CAU 1670 TaxID=3032599 RepID=UPI0023D9F5CB|nr:UDP-3-O-(3-hydroxymyristoyl)glucosamine N-acyltransferase [Albimonas sp. CAU 1670]MDF2233066.1 UDP-3-O-(3-hydroxymyristoyl)glucosamine N-acyltransferase [Albimonas sp. CAU 1670]